MQEEMLLNLELKLGHCCFYYRHIYKDITTSISKYSSQLDGNYWNQIYMNMCMCLATNCRTVYDDWHLIKLPELYSYIIIIIIYRLL